MKYKHLFFDMDQTVAPARQLILPEMFNLLSNATQDIIIVSGQEVEKIKWQSNNLKAVLLGQNGNHAEDMDSTELWDIKLTDEEQAEILAHIDTLVTQLDEQPNPEYTPIENRGGQITFSPIGNTAPVALKMAYDPDRKKRDSLLEVSPFTSNELIVKIGGSTSLDYIHKDRHKGTNVQKLIDYMGWDNDECVYFGDGLFPGGNDEAVIGVVETIAVDDHLDCYKKLTDLLESAQK
ncbi:MAG: phosphomannomutase [Acidimicrobiales bacterium]|jgi:phosphomannomutase